MFEENKPDAGAPPTSGETPETPEPEPKPEEKPEGGGEGGGAADQSAEIDRLKKEAADKDALLKKQDREINQQRYKIGRMEKKAGEEGVDLSEPETPGISEEKVSEIVTEAQKPLLEKIEKMGTTISEIARANQAQPNPNPAGPGQRQPAPPKEPELDSAEKGVVRRNNLQWTGKGRIYKSPKTGRTYDFDDKSDVA